MDLTIFLIRKVFILESHSIYKVYFVENRFKPIHIIVSSLLFVSERFV